MFFMRLRTTWPLHSDVFHGPEPPLRCRRFAYGYALDGSEVPCYLVCRKETGRRMFSWILLRLTRWFWTNRSFAHWACTPSMTPLHWYLKFASWGCSGILRLEWWWALTWFAHYRSRGAACRTRSSPGTFGQSKCTGGRPEKKSLLRSFRPLMR